MNKDKTRTIIDVYNRYLGFVIYIVFRKHVYPPLVEFSSSMLDRRINRDVINTMFKKLIGDQATSIIEKEFESLNEIILERYKKVILTYPVEYGIEYNTSFLIYSLVRLLKPNKVVETGVANGHSTFFILNALVKNENGFLYSIDANNDVGSLIDEKLKQYWNLYVLPRVNRRTLSQYIEKIAPVDIFIHDTNHLYYWQMMEYRIFLKNISDGGFILSDDVDSSYAFIDFCGENKLEPFFLYDNRKIFGLTKVLKKI
jgi:predicted O-methyltransferase YrrM